MGKFDAAINVLRLYEREVSGVTAAIHVLEAAGKVNKEDLILTVRAMMLVCQTTSDDEKSLDNLLEFLAALPED